MRQVLWPPAAVPRLVRVCGRQTAKAEIDARPVRVRAGGRPLAGPGERPRASRLLDNCAPNHLHLEPCLAAIRAGKHVFCEKPLGRSAAEARELRDAAARAGVVHMVGFNYRFLPAVQLARRLIDEGRLGRIHHFRARFADASFLDPDAPFTWHQDAEAAGSNALLDLGSHLIDLARYLVGEPSAVSGAVATFTADRPGPGHRPAPPGRDGGRLRGDRRVRERRAREPCRHEHGGRPAGAHDLRAQRLRAARSPSTSSGSTACGSTSSGSSPAGGGLREIHVTDADHPYGGAWWPPGHSIGWDASLVHELGHFLGAVRGRASPAAPLGATFEDGYRCAVVCDAILEAARSGRRVQVSRLKAGRASVVDC